MVALLLLVATPALAAEKPVTRPTRDVDVTYRAEVGGKPMQQRIRVAAAAGKTRIDTPSPGLYMLVDRARRDDGYGQRCRSGGDPASL